VVSVDSDPWAMAIMVVMQFTSLAVGLFSSAFIKAGMAMAAMIPIMAIITSDSI
jgi:hypothetical protein